MISEKTKKLRAVQILLGHTQLESTVRYLGIEVDDTLDLAKQLEVWPAGRRPRGRCSTRWRRSPP